MRRREQRRHLDVRLAPSSDMRLRPSSDGGARRAQPAFSVSWAASWPGASAGSELAARSS
jgi:hypothetical protein